MNVLKRTPRSEMKYQSLIRKSEGIAETLAAALEAGVEDVQGQLNVFLWISSGVEFETGEIEWQPATGLDDEANIAAKFLRYMDSDVEPIDQAARLMRERDRPYDETPALEGVPEKN